MKFTLEIQMDNAAFEENPSELADIIDELQTPALSAGPGDVGTVRDSNGNTVGKWEVSA